MSLRARGSAWTRDGTVAAAARVVTGATAVMTAATTPARLAAQHTTAHARTVHAPTLSSPPAAALGGADDMTAATRAIRASFGVRTWPTPGGSAAGPAVGVHVRRDAWGLRVRVDGTLADATVRSRAGRRASVREGRTGGGPDAGAGPRLLDGRAVLASVPRTLARRGPLGPVGIDAAVGAERDAYDPRSTWTQRGGQVRAWSGTAARGVWGAAGAFAPQGVRATPKAVETRGGAWARRGPVTAGVALRRVTTRDSVETYDDSTAIIPSTCRATYNPSKAPLAVRSVCQARYATTDAYAALAWAVGGASLRVQAVARVARRGRADAPGTAGGAWAGAGLVLPRAGPLVVSVDVARQPPDPVRGMPANTRVFVGAQWWPFRRPAGDRGATDGRLPVLAACGEGSGAPSVVVRDRPSGTASDAAERSQPEHAQFGAATADPVPAPHLLVFTLGRVTSAEVRGDFTSWRPTPLTRAADGSWEMPAALTSGLHTLSVRTDGGAWQPPAGLPAVDDEFGEQVGVLLVADSSGDLPPHARCVRP